MGKLQAKREEFLMKALLSTGRISTQEATRSLGVSEATVRRLFSSMEHGGKVVRDYGGIVLLKRFDEGSLKSVQIVTNSLANLQALVPRFKVTLLGGDYNALRRDFTGPISERFLEFFHFSKCFLGVEGVSVEEGFSSSEANTTRLNHLVLLHSDKAFVLADASKIGSHAFISYAALGQVNGIITAGYIGPEQRAALIQNGAKLMDAYEYRRPQHLKSIPGHANPPAFQ